MLAPLEFEFCHSKKLEPAPKYHFEEQLGFLLSKIEGIKRSYYKKNTQFVTTLSLYSMKVQGTRQWVAL